MEIDWINFENNELPPVFVDQEPHPDAHVQAPRPSNLTWCPVQCSAESRHDPRQPWPLTAATPDDYDPWRLQPLSTATSDVCDLWRPQTLIAAILKAVTPGRLRHLTAASPEGLNPRRPLPRMTAILTAGTPNGCVSFGSGWGLFIEKCFKRTFHIIFLILFYRSICTFVSFLFFLNLFWIWVWVYVDYAVCFIECWDIIVILVYRVFCNFFLIVNMFL